MIDFITRAEDGIVFNADALGSAVCDAVISALTFAVVLVVIGLGVVAIVRSLSLTTRLKIFFWLRGNK